MNADAAPRYVIVAYTGADRLDELHWSVNDTWEARAVASFADRTVAEDIAAKLNAGALEAAGRA